MIRPILAAVLLLAASRADSFAESSFTGLGFRPGGTNSSAYAVSANGKVVVGISKSASGQEAFRWTAASGMVGLGLLPGRTNSFITRLGVSSNGSVVFVTILNSAWRYQSFRWTAKDGLVGLGTLPGKKDVPFELLIGSSAAAISDDGSVVVGQCQTIQTDVEAAFRWTVAGGMTSLGVLPGGWSSRATAISSDGKVIVGSCRVDSDNQAFRWTEAGGMVKLGILPESSSEAVSSDGSVIVGSFASRSGMEAFRWTAAKGMVGLGLLPGDIASEARAVSDNGSVVVGRCNMGEQVFRWTEAEGMVGLGHLSDKMIGRRRYCEATWVSKDGSVILGHDGYWSPGEIIAEEFFWDSIHGMRLPQSVLANDCKLELSGWKQCGVNSISADGRTMVGFGQHNGRNEAWVAHLDKPLNAPAAKGKSQQTPSAR